MRTSGLFFLAAIAAIGLVSGGSSGGTPAPTGAASQSQAYKDCRLKSQQTVALEHNFTDITAKDFVTWSDDHCLDICPRIGHGLNVCSDEAHHKTDFPGWFANLMWPIAFLCIALVIGALGQRCFKQMGIPYTVGLIIIGIVLGLAATLTSLQQYCPHHALDPAFDSDHDGIISRAEYDSFICTDCDPASICAAGSGWPRTCGGGCLPFDLLDSPFRYTPLDPAYAGQQAHDNSRDGKLQPDELWRPGCNLLTSLIGLADMDPHLCADATPPPLSPSRPPTDSPPRARPAPSLLVVFLPPLLFESAYAMDIAVFQKQLWQILTLAIPGAVAASLLTAAIVKGVYSTWDFWQCWLLGTILSATDPVAVVALLKELGAAKTLGGLIEGESLLNDGSSIVFFTFIMSAIKFGTEAIPFVGSIGVELVRILAQMLVLGPIFGVIMGYLTIKALRNVYNDMLVETAIVVSMGYLTFWLGEIVLRSSAVLAIVVFGLYINLEKACISVEVHHFLHQFFEMVAYMLNTVIFLICGAKLGAILAKLFVGLADDGMSHTDILYGFVIYLGINFVRLVTTGLFYPLLKRIGTGLDWRNMLVIVWGGLRGSVGLALALVVHHTQYMPYWGGGTVRVSTTSELACRDVPVKILIITCWIVLLTVIVNGSLVAKLIQKLGLDELSDDRKFMLHRAVKKLRSETAVIIAGLRAANDAGDVDWGQVRERFTFQRTFELQIEDHRAAAQQQALNMERMSYLEQHEKGEITDAAASKLALMMLTLQAKASAEPSTSRGYGRSAAQQQAYDEAFTQLLDLFRVSPMKIRLQKLPLTREWAGRAVFDDLSLAYEVAKAYIKASESVQKLYELQNRHSVCEPSGSARSSVDPADEHRATVGGGALARISGGAEAPGSAPAGASVGAPSPPDSNRSTAASTHLRRTSHQASVVHLGALKSTANHREGYARRMRDEIKNMQLNYPDVSNAVETRYAATMVLRRQLKVVEHMQHDGELSEMDAAALCADINKQRKDLFYSHPHRLGAKPDDVALLEVPAFRFLAAARKLDWKDPKGLTSKAGHAAAECHVLLERLLDKALKTRLYSNGDEVASPSMLQKSSKHDHSELSSSSSQSPRGATPSAEHTADGAPVPSRTRGKRASIRQSVMMRLPPVLGGTAGTPLAERSTDSPMSAEHSQKEADREHGAWLDVYDKLLIVKRGLLSYQPAPTMVPIALGPGSTQGVAHVLQVVGAESGRKDDVTPTVWCERAAEVMLISGHALRAAIVEGGMAGEALERELWCMYANELGKRTLPARKPYSTWSAHALAEHLERGTLLEYSSTADDFPVKMLHPGLLINGEAALEPDARAAPPSEAETASGANSGAAVSAALVEHSLADWHRLDSSIGESSDFFASADLAPISEGAGAAEAEAAPLVWKEAPVVLRAGQRVRFRERRHGAGHWDGSLPGRTKVRLLVLPVEGTPLLMDAANVLPIAPDTSHSSRYGGESPMRLSRVADVRQSMSRASSQGALGDSIKRAGGGAAPRRLVPPSPNAMVRRLRSSTQSKKWSASDAGAAGGGGVGGAEAYGAMAEPQPHMSTLREVEEPSTFFSERDPSLCNPAPSTTQSEAVAPNAVGVEVAAGVTKPPPPQSPPPRPAPTRIVTIDDDDE